jgi:hypothetical protein
MAMPKGFNGALPAMLAMALLAGCATPMQPVADFGGAADHLAAVYKPFGKGMDRSCEQALRYKAIGGAGPFDDAKAQSAAATECDPYKQAEETATLFAQALSDYASALTKMSHARPTAFDSDIKGISGAANRLETRDGSALFDSHAIGAASKLARAAAVLLLQDRIERLTRATLQDNQEALTTLVEAMKKYATALYYKQLEDTRDVMRGELRRLVAASNAPSMSDVEARLPWRYAQATARSDIAANELEARRVRDFVRSADALLAAHAALIENFDKINGAQRLALVSDFVSKVQAIKDDADEL